MPPALGIMTQANFLSLKYITSLTSTIPKLPIFRCTLSHNSYSLINLVFNMSSTVITFYVHLIFAEV